jgi:DNA-binding SARP family transcriptional activator/streptogramin lyase
LPDSDDSLDFRILGSFEAFARGKPLEVGGGKQRALLAVLLLNGREVVSTDRLIDALWEDEPPASALNSVHVYVSQLRKALGDGRLETHGHGYRIALEREQIDLGRFERLLGEGRELLAAGDAGRAAEVLRAALALWRGPPLSDFASEPFSHAEIARLEELRLAALEERIEADLALGRQAELVSELEALVCRHPLRERLRAQLMVSLYRSGRQAEALAAYEQARRMLAEELGLDPGRTLQELERAILRQDATLDLPGQSPARPPPATDPGRKPSRRKRVALAAASLLVVAAAAIALALVARDEPPPPAVLANSLVRIDPTTMKPTKVVPIGNKPDIVVAAGGFLWVTHDVLRDYGSAALRNRGDRTLTRVDPSTADVVVVGGGLAPCGLTADPSGDVWVANCYASGSGTRANVQRIAAKTLEFGPTWSVPGGKGFYRGLAYGGGSLWVSGIAGPNLSIRRTLTEVDPRTGAKRPIRLRDPTGPLAWSEGYGDLWISNFPVGAVSRLHAATGIAQVLGRIATSPSMLTVDGDVVWVSDWAAPRVVRLRAVGASRPRTVPLPTRNRTSGVWCVAADAGAIWATTPRDGALWRIDPGTNHIKRIPVPHLPTCVTAGPDGELWMTVRRG